MGTRLDVIPNKYWKHISGRRASLYGSAPWLREADRADWTLVTDGFTIRDNRENTIGRYNLAGLPRDRETVQRYADLAESYDWDGIKALRAEFA